jgi:hypothetical protein
VDFTYRGGSIGIGLLIGSLEKTHIDSNSREFQFYSLHDLRRFKILVR